MPAAKTVAAGQERRFLSIHFLYRRAQSKKRRGTKTKSPSCLWLISIFYRKFQKNQFTFDKIMLHS